MTDAQTLRFSVDGGLDDRIDAQIAFAGRRRADVDGAVRIQDVQGAPVGVRVNGDGLDAEITAGAGLNVCLGEAMTAAVPVLALWPCLCGARNRLRDLQCRSCGGPKP